MITLIKSLLGNKGDKYKKILDTVLDMDNVSLLSPQELEQFKYLDETYNLSEVLPSEEYFIDKFKELERPLSTALVLEGNDLRIHLDKVLSDRRNLRISGELIRMANEVNEKGFTFDNLESLRSMVKEESKEDITDNTIDSNSFENFYRRKKEKPIGLLTNIEDIDNAIGGLAIGSMTTILGYVASYKTTLAMNIVYENCIHNNYNICIISLEVSKEEALASLLGIHSTSDKFKSGEYSDIEYLPHTKIKRTELTPREEEFLFNEVTPDFFNTGGEVKVLDETDFSTFSFSEIRNHLEKVDDEFIKKTGKGLDALVVDHIHLFKFTEGGNRDGNAEINKYTSYFRKLSQAFRPYTDENGVRQYSKLCVILLAQANREGWKRAVKNNGRYDLRAIAEANELERGSHVVLSIYTDDNMKQAQEAGVMILKNRSGATTPDPVIVYANPIAYVVSGETAGFSMSISSDEALSAFDDINF